jgi:hypothetical protein
LKGVGMDAFARGLEADFNLDTFMARACLEIKERVLVACELVADLVNQGRGRIVAQESYSSALVSRRFCTFLNALSAASSNNTK